MVFCVDKTEPYQNSLILYDSIYILIVLLWATLFMTFENACERRSSLRAGMLFVLRPHVTDSLRLTLLSEHRFHGCFPHVVRGGCRARSGFITSFILATYLFKKNGCWLAGLLQQPCDAGWLAFSGSHSLSRWAHPLRGRWACPFRLVSLSRWARPFRGRWACPFRLLSLSRWAYPLRCRWARPFRLLFWFWFWVEAQASLSLPVLTCRGSTLKNALRQDTRPAWPTTRHRPSGCWIFYKIKIKKEKKNFCMPLSL